MKGDDFTLNSTVSTEDVQDEVNRKIPDLDDTCFHHLYLQDDAVGFLAPIHFEDGMDWIDCQRYYALIADGNTELRSLYHRKLNRRLRKPSKRDLLNDNDYRLRSCLRSTTSSRPERSTNVRPPMRRSFSFNTLPKLNTSFSHFYGEAISDVGESARVTFDQEVAIVTIRPIDDYPEEIQDALWMSREEINKSVRDFMRADILSGQDLVDNVLANVA